MDYRELTYLGLAEKEAKVYLAALELGKSPVQKIAEKAGLQNGQGGWQHDKIAKRCSGQEVQGCKGQADQDEAFFFPLQAGEEEGQ